MRIAHETCSESAYIKAGTLLLAIDLRRLRASCPSWAFPPYRLLCRALGRGFFFAPKPGSARPGLGGERRDDPIQRLAEPPVVFGWFQRRLVQIKGPVQLDLHGLRRDDAREALSSFIRESHKHGIRCVRVVHGKGLGSPGKAPILKSRVHSWLVQKKEVLAFVQAKPADGGAGALLVLLMTAQ
eukprot:gene45934-61401_t